MSKNNRKPDRFHAIDRIFHIQGVHVLAFATPPLASPSFPAMLTFTAGGMHVVV